MSGARGVTLVEVMVVLAILGLMAGVAALTGRPIVAHHEPNQIAAQMAAARRQSLETGMSVTITLVDSAGILVATAKPDGRVITDGKIPVDRFTGRTATDAR